MSVCFGRKLRLQVTIRVQSVGIHQVIYITSRYTVKRTRGIPRTRLLHALLSAASKSGEAPCPYGLDQSHAQLIFNPHENCNFLRSNLLTEIVTAASGHLFSPRAVNHSQIPLRGSPRLPF